MEEVALIKLDDLNPKQKAREYKSTQKEVKSKELAVKQKGLEKVKDVRYFVDGGCLQPLINSISVKKTALELSKLTIDSLLNFFQSSSRTDKSTIVASLNAIFTTENNLEILKVLSDVVNYREEVKKKKPVKVKGKVVEVPEEPVIENPLVVELREKSLQCIYYIVCSFYSDFSAETSALLSAVANVTDITSQFGRLVCNLNTELAALSADGDVTQRVKVMQNLEFALFSLVFFLRYDRSSALSGLLATPLLPSIQALSKEAFFSHYAVQLLEIISRNVDSGVVALVDGSTLEFIVQLLPIVVKPLQEASAALAAAAVPGKKEVKKEAPPKKGAPVVAEVVDPYASVERIALEPKRQSVADTKLLCNVLIAIAVHQSASISDSACEAVSSLLSPTLLNSVLWEVTREPLSSPLDVPLHDTVDTICVLLGTLCEKVPALRNIVVQTSGLSSVLSVLQQSKTIVNGTEPVAAEVAEKSRAFLQLRLNNLRRVAGKAALHLITPQCILPTEDEEQAGIVSKTSSRWQSCGGFSTDTATLIATPALFTQIIDLIAVADDVDLSNRGVRLLSAVLLCCGDSSSTAEFIAKTGLDTLVSAKLSVVAQSRGQSIIDFFAEEAARTAIAAAMAAEKEALAVVDGDLGENGEVVEKDESMSAAVSIAVEEKTPFVDLLVPSMFESFYLALSMLEQFLTANNPATTPDVLKAFVTRERVKVLSQVLTVLGPLPSAQLAKEHTVVLRDPRVHNWYHTIDCHNTNAAAVPATAANSDVADSKSEFIRPLLMDVLALVASADAKYRAYEGEVPPSPATAVPASKSVVEEYSLAVCRLCADAVCSIVLLQGQFKFLNSSLTVAPAKDTKQEVLVLDAALRLLTAIASCGVLGVTAAVEAIAESGFAVSGAPSGAMSSMLSLLRSDESFAIPEGYEWKRPQFFSDVFPGDAVLTRQENISNSHILFPFIVLCGALHGVLADPTSTRHSAYLAMQAVVGITRVSCLGAHSQPVVTEVLSAAFVSLGGALTLTSLLGRFGNLDASDQQSLSVEEFMTYLLSRGASRESFWAKYADDNKVVEVIDPKTGKPVVKKEEKKKDPPKDKKVDPKTAVALPPIVAEILYNIESSVEVPDPNRGPTAAQWRPLLEISLSDLHINCDERAEHISPLVSAIQSTLPDIALQLIALGVNVQSANTSRGESGEEESDSHVVTGVTPLMYSLLLRRPEVANALIIAGADANAIDHAGNPVIKYAAMSISESDVTAHLACHRSPISDSESRSSIKLYGSAALLPLLLEASTAVKNDLDINVRDAKGYGPVMTAMGMGAIEVTVGGYLLCVENHNSVANSEFGHYSPEKPMYADIALLREYKANVNDCDRLGVAPLHIAAGRGDVLLVKQLFRYAAVCNVLDNKGFLPIHYAAACCPRDSATAVETLTTLLSNSTEKPVERMEFTDQRTGRAKEEKSATDLSDFINAAFQEAFCPAIIQKARLTYHDLLLLRTDEHINILQLCMGGHVFLAQDERLGPFLVANKHDRMTFALHLIGCMKGYSTGAEDLFNNSDDFNLNILHCCGLLFQGTTPQRELTAAEIRSKRVKTYPSMELHLLDLIHTHMQSVNSDDLVIDVNASCSRPTELGAEWSAMHAAVVFNNLDLVKWLLGRGFYLECGAKWCHIIAAQQSNRAEVSFELAKLVVSSCADSVNYKAYLNDCDSAGFNARPLHLAVRNCNTNVIKALVSCHKIDLNAVDEVSGLSAFHEACVQNHLEVVQAFRPGADRLDLVGSQTSGSNRENCIEHVINNNYLDVLLELVNMRRNDVIESVITKRHSTDSAGSDGEDSDHSGDTLLIRLERNNLALATSLGLSHKKAKAAAIALEMGAEGVVVEAVVVKPEEGGDPTDEDFALAKEIEKLGLGGEESAAEDEEQVADHPVENTAGGDQWGAEEDGGEGGEEGEEAAVVEAPPEEELVCTLSPEEVVETTELLRKSNALLRVLIQLVNSTGIVDESHHLSAEYFLCALLGEENLVEEME